MTPHSMMMMTFNCHHWQPPALLQLLPAMHQQMAAQTVKECSGCITAAISGGETSSAK